MDLSAYSSWKILIQIGIIFVAILTGNTLRRKISFIRSSLLPSSVIAGILIFIFKFIPYINEYINSAFMEALTYHCLGLGFIALTLKSSVKSKDTNKYAVLTGTAEEGNPAYPNGNIEEVFPLPVVAIPVATQNDTYTAKLGEVLNINTNNGIPDIQITIV